MINIHICHKFYPIKGGIQKYIENIIRYQSSHSQVYILTTLPIEFPISSFPYKQNKIFIYYHPTRFELFRNPINFSIYKTLENIIKSNNYNQKINIYLHGIEQFTTLVSSIFLRKLSTLKHINIKLLVHQIITDSFFQNQLNLIIKKFYYLLFNVISKNLLNSIIVLDQTHLKSISNILKLPENSPKFSVIPNGINLDYFKIEKNLDHTLKFKNKIYTILFIGRLTHVKQPLEIIKLAYLFNNNVFPKNFPQLNFEIIGNGELLAHITDSIKMHNLKNIKVIGELSSKKLKDKMLKSQFLIIPSISEGFPNILLEAWATGMIPITSNIPIFNNLIQHGQNGYIFNDLRDISRYIIETHEDFSKTKVLMNHINTNLKLYSWDLIYSKFDKL